MKHPMSPPPATSHHDLLLDAFRRYEPRLLRYAHSLCHDLELSQDAVQDAFIRLARDIRRLEPGDFGAWLFSVCRNRLFDLMRRAGKQQPLDEGFAEEPDAAPLPDAVAALREDAQHLQQLVARLPAAQRDVVRLRFIGGLSYQEIAGVTKQSAGTVGWLLHEALQSLRKHCKNLVP
jgi:RNA polymerase sigma-70 factor (ECF subfamily)